MKEPIYAVVLCSSVRWDFNLVGMWTATVLSRRRQALANLPNPFQCVKISKSGSGADVYYRMDLALRGTPAVAPPISTFLPLCARNHQDSLRLVSLKNQRIRGNMYLLVIQWSFGKSTSSREACGVALPTPPSHALGVP